MEIRQELDLLKREVRTSYPPPGPPAGVVPARRSIASAATIRTIRDALERNIPEDAIIASLETQGIHQDWTRRKIEEIKAGDTPIEEICYLLDR